MIAPLLAAKRPGGKVCSWIRKEMGIGYRSFATAVRFCLAAALATAWAAAADQTSTLPTFGSVIRAIQYTDVESGKPLNRQHYDRSAGLMEGAVLTRSGLKTAVQALYDTGGFAEIAVNAVPKDGSTDLEFRLRPALFFNRFTIRGGADLGGSSVMEALSLPVGARFSETSLEEARQQVLKLAAERGYYQAQVDAAWKRDGESVRVDVVFRMQLGHLARIQSLRIAGVPPQEETSIRKKLHFKEGDAYARDRFAKSMDSLKSMLMDRGFLGAETQWKETYHVADNSIAIDVSIANFGQVRIGVEGFKIPKDQLRRLLPMLSGEGVNAELIDEGIYNLRDFLEGRGYLESAVSVFESGDTAGERLLRYTVERGRKVMVREVQFRGNHAISASDLMNAVQIRPPQFQQRVAYAFTRLDSLLQSSTYSISKLDSDVESLRALYRSSGYLDAAVIPLIEMLENGKEIRIIYECVEGPQSKVKSVIFNVADGSPAVAFESRLKLKENEPFSPYRVQRDRQAIFAAYTDAGFLQTEVTAQVDGPDADHRFTVTFRIVQHQPSYVESVLVFGKDRTRDSVVQKRIRIQPGESLSLGKMLETQQALYDTGVFDQVRVEPQNPESVAPYQNVIVRLQEARPLTLRYGFGYQEREKVRGIVELSDPNFLGMGQSANLRLRGSTIEQAGVLSIKQPQVLFLPVDSYLTFSASKKQQISFDEKRLDLSYQYSRPINDHAWNMLRYTLTNVRVSHEPVDLAREERPRNLSTFSAFYINDTRDNYTDPNARYLDPQKGFFTSTDAAFTVNHGDGGYYVSLYSQNSFYRRLPGGLLLASALRIGLLGPIGGDKSIPVGQRIPISERFFAGGASSLRGFTSDRAGPLGLNGEPIGGNALLIGNLELRIPLVSRMELAGFYDGGNVYSTPGAMRFSTFSHAVGFGLRIKTPLGPIRVDYGFNLNLSSQLKSYGYKSGHFFVTIGPPF
jgi:outer membrane protein insertion porin family